MLENLVKIKKLFDTENFCKDIPCCNCPLYSVIRKENMTNIYECGEISDAIEYTISKIKEYDKIENEKVQM